jgi:hypothetical protein
MIEGPEAAKLALLTIPRKANAGYGDEKGGTALGESVG